MSSSRRRAGLTIIEILVIVSIIAVLSALLFPAIQAAREKARRNQCKSNLRTVALALINYCETHRVYPAGTDFGGPAEHPVLWSWQMKVLPGCKEKALYDSLDVAAGIAGAANRRAIEQAVVAFHCPSDPYVNRVYEETSGVFAGGWSLTNYLGVSGSNAAQTEDGQGILSPSQCDVLDRGDNAQSGRLGFSSGMFYGDSAISDRDISDGTANTLMVGERGVPPTSEHGWWTGPGLVSACPAGWTDVVLPSNDRFQLGGLRQPTGHYDDCFHWWSHHEGGAQFAKADGGTVFLGYAMDQATLQSFCTRAGQESARIPSE